MIKQFNANKARQKRHLRLRNRLDGTQERPRLSVFRSDKQIYAQVIDDSTGRTLAEASSLDESLKDFTPAPRTEQQPMQAESSFETEEAAPVAAPAKRANKEAKNVSRRVTSTSTKGALPAAPKHEKKTPVEALAAISNNHKVALAHEVGKLVAERAKEKGIEQVVFDRGGYPYHGRVAALAEGAREVGLKF